MGLVYLPTWYTNFKPNVVNIPYICILWAYRYAAYLSRARMLLTPRNLAVSWSFQSRSMKICFSKGGYFHHGQPTSALTYTPRNKGLIASLIKRNHWVFCPRQLRYYRGLKIQAFSFHGKLVMIFRPKKWSWTEKIQGILPFNGHFDLTGLPW